MLHSARRQLASVMRSLGSLLPRTGDQPPAGSAIVRPWREDASHTYPTIGLSPARVLACLQVADAGSPQVQFDLYSEMLQKWPRLAAVEATRRLALTGLEWDLVPPRVADEDAARRVADYCRAALEHVETLRDALSHLARAIGHGIAVAEIIWEDGQLRDLVPVPLSRLIADPQEPWRVRVRTAEEPTWGVPLDAQPTKWLVQRLGVPASRPFSGGLLRTSVAMYLAQNLGFKDWLTYLQLAGMPVRIGRYDHGTPDGEKRELLRLLSRLGTDVAAVISKGVELEFVQPGGGGRPPYQALQDHCNTEVTILWLGQHLTTDIRTSGSRAAAEIHDRVREDLLVDDIASEGVTVRRDLLTPLVRSRFGEGVAVPQFRRSLVQSVDTKVLAETLAVAVRELGLQVPRRWLHDTLGVPLEDEPQNATGVSA